VALDVGVRQERGRRPYQEDEVLIRMHESSSEPPEAHTHLFGVFDGHAGGRCSKFVAGAMRDTLLESRSFSDDLKSAFAEAYRVVNNKFLYMAEKGGWHDGSTGLCIALRGGRVTVANVGDCRVVVVSNRKVEQLSNDHKPSSKNEHARIIALGGCVVNCIGVSRVNGILAVSRAFGNRSLREVIRPDPELNERELTLDDHYIVIASDGVWDVLKNADIFRLCWELPRKTCQQLANEVIRLALVMGSQDNVSCIVIGLATYLAGLSSLHFGMEGRPSLARSTLSSTSLYGVAPRPRDSKQPILRPLLLEQGLNKLSMRPVTTRTRRSSNVGQEVLAFKNRINDGTERCRSAISGVKPLMVASMRLTTFK
jgi:serine/threonine protein phosphatase PrpC